MALRFVNAKNLNEYISEDNMLASWGGKDDYQFKFTPEQRSGSSSEDTTNGRNELAMQKDENDNTTFSDNNNNNNNNNVKKVCAQTTWHDWSDTWERGELAPKPAQSTTEYKLINR